MATTWLQKAMMFWGTPIKDSQESAQVAACNFPSPFGGLPEHGYILAAPHLLDQIISKRISNAQHIILTVEKPDGFFLPFPNLLPGPSAGALRCILYHRISLDAIG